MKIDINITVEVWKRWHKKVFGITPEEAKEETLKAFMKEYPQLNKEQAKYMLSKVRDLDIYGEVIIDPGMLVRI